MHRFPQQLGLSRHVLAAAVHARSQLVVLAKCRVKARQLLLALFHRVINVVVPLEVSWSSGQDVYVEVGDGLARGSAILHGELQAFGVEDACDGAAHTLCKLPHVADLGWQQVGEEFALDARCNQDMTRDMHTMLQF